MERSPELSLLIKAALRGENQSWDIGVNVDEKKLHQLADWHQIRSLLYDYVSLSEATVDVAHLKDQSVSEALYNMIFLRRSIDMSSALAAGGVHAFLMKGAFWAWWLYENPGFREFGDIDFFIREEELEHGLKVLGEFGYKPDSYRSYLFSDESVKKVYLRTDYQLPLKPDTNDPVGSVEVQWNATYPRFAYTFSWTELMATTMTVRLSGNDIVVPDVESQLLLMLVHHAGVEQWDKLKFMADFVRLLRKFGEEIDWERVVRKTKEKGFYRLLLESLGMVRFLTGEDYLRHCHVRTADMYPTISFRNAILGHWENSREIPQTKSWQIFLYNMRYRDRLRDKVKILFRHVAYLLEWQLLIPKAKWYYSKKR